MWDILSTTRREAAGRVCHVPRLHGSACAKGSAGKALLRPERLAQNGATCLSAQAAIRAQKSWAIATATPEPTYKASRKAAPGV